MNISLSPGDWTKLRQLLQWLFRTKYFVPDIKKGTSQADAKAAKDELWADTSDGYTVKVGQ